MAEYRAKGLFEAMQASKNPPPRPATPVVLRPPPAKTPSGPRVADVFGDAGGRVARGETGRSVVKVVVLVAVAFGLAWGGKTLLNRYESWSAAREKPNVVIETRPPVEVRVAELPVPGVATVPEAPAETVPPPEGHHGGVLPSTGERPIIGSATGGAFRIQVFSAPARNHDEIEKERRKLATAGFETVVEHQGTRSFIFTAATFATADGEETVEALKKIRALGYGSAYATRKQTGNR